MIQISRNVFRAAAIVASGVLAMTAQSQLTTQRTYYGVSRAMPITISAPEAEQGPLTIHLMGVSSETIQQSDEVKPGEVDLASVFPSLWKNQGQQGVLYAQLFAGDSPVGAAIVLQPMISPPIATLDQRSGQVVWPPSQQIFSGYRAYVEKYAIMHTSEGDITFRFRPDKAPNTVWNFMTLSDGGFYTDIIFHRIVSKPNPFVIQAGDPRGEGNGGPGYFVDLERSTLPHDFGVLSMARSGDPNSNGSQIFVCLSREYTKMLDGRYTSFGEAVGGADAILKISNTELTPEPNSSTPVNPPLIESVELVDAPPRGTGPDPVKRPEADTPSGR